MSQQAHQPNSSKQQRRQHEHRVLSDILDDLSMRFIVNLPAEEFESFERLFFAIESAHWFYDDFYREQDSTLPRLPLKQFAARLFEHTALLSDYRHEVDRLFSQFQSYKQEVPTCGAAMLNPAMDKVLLVRGWGRDARWSFPKGKLAKDETELACAIREVEEETGFDMTPLVSDSTFFIDSYTSGRCSRIFCVPGVPEDTVFMTQTRKEISAIDWVQVSALPDTPKMARQHNKANAPKDGAQSDKPRMLFAQHSLVPFTKRLRSWIKRQRKLAAQQSTKPPTSTQSLPPFSPPTYASALRASPPLTSPQAATAAPLPPLPGALSVEDLEAKLTQQQQHQHQNQHPSHPPLPASHSQPVLPKAGMSTPPRRRTGRKQKGGVDPAAKSGGTRKLRRDFGGAEAERNRTTFGDSADMSNADRDSLFCQYVLETDSRMQAKGPSDEFWPVPVITSNDFTEQQRRDAEKARQARLKRAAAGSAGNGAAKPIPIENYARAARSIIEDDQKKPPDDHEKSTPTAIDGFSFDRAAIMSSMLKKDSS